MRCALYTKSDREKSDWWNLKRVVLLKKTMLQDVSPASSHSSNNTSVQIQRLQTTTIVLYNIALVAGAWTERKKIFHGGSFLKLADDKLKAQNPEVRGF